MSTRSFSWHIGLSVLSFVVLRCGGSTETVPLGNGGNVNESTTGGSGSTTAGSGSGGGSTASGGGSTASGGGSAASGGGTTTGASGGGGGACVASDCAGQVMDAIAKLCPDGTGVGRTLCTREPDGTCAWDFPPCPSQTNDGGPAPIDAGRACCPASWGLYACAYPDGTPGMQCHNPQMGCASSNICGQGCDAIVSGRCDQTTTGGGSSSTVGSTGAGATGGSTCPSGQIWCPGCTPGTGACYSGGCPGFACGPIDAGRSDASSVACSQATTLNDCEARSDCHSVFVDPGTCGCAGIGCCAHFNHCADGDKAACTSSTVACTVATPHCEGKYVVAYTNVCFEGCVDSKDCAP